MFNNIVINQYVIFPKWVLCDLLIWCCVLMENIYTYNSTREEYYNYETENIAYSYLASEP